METRINNIGNNQIPPQTGVRRQGAMNIQKDENFSQEITSALENLSMLDNSSKLREDAIQNGKAIIANWQAPTDEQIAKIFDKLKDEYIKVS